MKPKLSKCQYSDLPESQHNNAILYRYSISTRRLLQVDLEAKCNRVATCELVDAFGEGKDAQLCNVHFYAVVNYKAEKYGVTRGPREWWGSKSVEVKP